MLSLVHWEFFVSLTRLKYTLVVLFYCQTVLICSNDIEMISLTVFFCLLFEQSLHIRPNECDTSLQEREEAIWIDCVECDCLSRLRGIHHTQCFNVDDVVDWNVSSLVSSVSLACCSWLSFYFRSPNHALHYHHHQLERGIVWLSLSFFIYL